MGWGGAVRGLGNGGEIMTPEQQRIAIAEWCGIKCKSCNNTGILNKFGDKQYAEIRSSQPHWLKVWPDKEPDIACLHNSLPNYLNDLNAMHEAEKKLLNSKYAIHLRNVTGHKYTDPPLWHATAAQRAEALLRTIEKWR